MESNESPILRGLNPAQYDAVVNYDAPSLIIAGAGSGKTRVLTSRIAYMIEQGVAPFNILALTFTNKAAESMRERIAQMLPDNRSRYIRMGTFHSVFSRILRENAERIGFTDSFTIYEPSDSKNLIKTIVRELNLLDEKYKPNVLASRISYAKNCLVTPGAYLANSVYATEDRQAQIPEFGNIYNIYCQRCKRNGAMDFDDLLLQTNILLRDCPDVLARYQEQFRYILVDEYQDTNYAQYTIIRRLSQTHSKVCVVGDDAQSIYSFRGAKIENILSFKKDYPSAMVFKLEQNYRSTRTIVDAANSVIARNSKRMEKHCFSDGDVGEKIRILKVSTDKEEAAMIVSDLRDNVRNAKDEWADVAILYRTNHQSRVLEDELRMRGIPYRIYKGASFYGHKEIKDLLAYIRLVINPRDDEAFKRIVNYPARGIGDTTVQRIAQLAAERGQSMWEAVDALVAEPAAEPVQRTIARKVTDFVAMIRALSLSRSNKSLCDFGLEIASQSGIIAAYRTENTPEATSALENIDELLKSMQEFEKQCNDEIEKGERKSDEKATIEEWLQSIMLMTDADKDDPQNSNKVTLMTVHSAKGLEYKYVYIVGVEEGLFPSKRTAESFDGLEEERRLFYVALTRAKVLATISCVDMRFNIQTRQTDLSRPSRFLQEIDPKYVDANFDLYKKNQVFLQQEDDTPLDLESLRRRYDYRYQQKQQGGGHFGGGSGGSGSRSGSYSGGSGGRSGVFGRPADGESGPARHFARAAQPRRSGVPDPALVQTPRPSTDGMRRVGVRQVMDGGLSAGSAAPVSGEYAVGQRVEHPKFGVGIVQRIETLATDHKLVVAFDNAGEKTLLAKFAKLTKL